MTEVLLELTSVSKRFGTTIALTDVDFSVAVGEIVGLVGKNGAGKSTLIKVIGGALKPDAGDFQWLGRPVPVRSPRACSDLGIAILHQENNLAPGLSIAETVGLSDLPRRGPVVDRRRLRKEARSILQTFGLGELDVDAPVGACTHVQQRMIMIAAALWRRSRLIVLDEPTASLTDEEIRHLHRVVREVAADGVSVVYVSHRLDEIVDLTTRVVVMRDARVVDDLPTSELTTERLIESIAGEESSFSPTTRSGSGSTGAEVLRVDGVKADGVYDASFALVAGEIVGIAGLVGSGRTELLRAIYGADRAESGVVVLDGRPYWSRSPRRSLRRGLAMLSEDRRRQGVVPTFDIRRNITVSSLDRVRLNKTLPVPSARLESASARNHIESLGVVCRDDRQALLQLSGGNQQKALLARWINTGCKVLLLDEPSVGVDVKGRADLYRIIRDIAAGGVGVLVVSSDFAELIEICDRIIVMRDGVLVETFEGKVSEADLLEVCYSNDANSMLV